MGAELRPFTQQDWDAFAGCGSLTPEIAELDELGATLILDGVTVQLILPPDDDGERFLSRDFSSPGVAKLVAKAIAASDQPLTIATELLPQASL